MVTLARVILAQGTSPRKLALTIALGVVIGILPIVWGATLLCALLACLFRLNQTVIQATNYLACPLQIALFIPFYRMGAIIFPWGASASVESIVLQLKTHLVGEFPLMLGATLKALAAWLIIAAPATILLYFLLLPIVTRIKFTNQDLSKEEIS